jgi:hypothetical protein
LHCQLLPFPHYSLYVTLSSVVSGEAGVSPTSGSRTLINMSKLSYSRGKFIPVSLTVQCLDTSALDLLQSPLAVSVFLLQCILTGKNAQSDKLRSPRDVKMIPIARAVCWHSSASAGEWDDCRTLMGEIALPENMPANSILPKVRIEVSHRFNPRGDSS